MSGKTQLGVANGKGAEQPINLAEYEKSAQEVLSEMAFDYYASGAHEEITLRANVEAYKKIALNYRVLVDVSNRDLSTTVLGTNIAFPVIVAPTAMQRLAHPDGELATARAAGRAGTIMTLSTLSTCSISEVAAVSAGPLWFQLYIYKDRAFTRALVQEAEECGYKALVLTVDSPILGSRERDIKNRLYLPEGMYLKNLLPFGLHDLPRDESDSGLATYLMRMYDASLSWQDLEWLRSITTMPLLIKGIVRADDAVKAIECGASAIVVSNHGGRQLDTAPATIKVLPEIVQAVDGRVEVLVDGGIRRGTDIVKAIALGARAVMVGRPVLWGLAVNGEGGVFDVLDLLRREFDKAMALCGCPSVELITSDLVGEM